MRELNYATTRILFKLIMAGFLLMISLTPISPIYPTLKVENLVNNKRQLQTLIEYRTLMMQLQN